MKSSNVGSKLWSSAVLSMACLLTGVLGGCTGGGIKGVAQAGPASVLTVVDETDKRAEAAGIAGVKINVEARPANGPARVLASSVTDGSGKFKLNVGDRDAQREQVWITAEKEGYTSLLSAPTYLPPEGRVLVVVLGTKKK